MKTLYLYQLIIRLTDLKMDNVPQNLPMAKFQSQVLQFQSKFPIRLLCGQQIPAHHIHQKYLFLHIYKFDQYINQFNFIFFQIQYYHFTTFAMALNEFPPSGELSKMCPTDSRLRPDMRLMEEGHIDRASEEKTRLEEKQREARKTRKNRKEKEEKARYYLFYITRLMNINYYAKVFFSHRWFLPSMHPFTKQESWFYRGGFWETKEYQALNIF